MSIIDGFFYLNAAVMIVSAALAMTKKNAVHALLYFILAVISLGVAFYLLEAPIAAALEVMVFAGAIMVLFVFVVMLLNIFKQHEAGSLKDYAIPIALAILLAAIFIGALSVNKSASSLHAVLGPKEVALSLFNDYSAFVELGSLILLAGLVGSFHLGKKISDEQ